MGVPLAKAQAQDLPYVSGLPSWLTLNGEYRGRLEAPSGISYKSGNEDFYYASRLRLNLGVRMGKWSRMFVQGQDSRLAGYSQGTPAASLQDPWDLRQAWMEFGKAEGAGVRVRVGRQELHLADGWLSSHSNWGNTARVFDAARITANFAGFVADGFASSVVLADGSRMDRHKPGEHFYGTYWSRPKMTKGGAVEGFLLAKTQVLVSGEVGGTGPSTLYLAGGRAVGKLPYRFDYSTWWGRQWGSYGPDNISAWGGMAQAGHTLSKHPMKPRLSAEIDIASGDKNSKDGVRGTFDQMYGGYHYLLGTADRLGLRNARHLRGGFDFAPSKAWKVRADVRDLAVMSVQDGLYNATGTREFVYAKATSRHIGVEFNSYFTYQINSVTQLGAGLGHVVPGAYLKQSGRTGSYTFPYVMVVRKF